MKVIAEADSAITAEVLAFRERLASLAKAQHEQCGRARALGYRGIDSPSYFERIVAAPGSALTIVQGHPVIHDALERARLV